MITATPYRQHKINLEDYDYQRDIQNRLLISHFSLDDLAILEAIIYSPTQFPVHELVTQTEQSLKEVLKTLEKLSQAKLLVIEGENIIINKEMRKYFENQLIKFESDFTPDMEFLQLLLKKVPIHVLPNWYPIPRSSNNIFDSLIERYLQTPQTFQRYLAELTFGDPILSEIVNDLLTSPTYKVYSKDLRKQYDLSQEKFEEHMLYLEFHFICCLVYEKKAGKWVEVVTLFREWKDYLSFLKDTQPKAIPQKGQKGKIRSIRPNPFSFVEDMATILTLTQMAPLTLRLNKKEEWVPEKQAACLIAEHCKGFDCKSEEGQAFFFDYTIWVIQKLVFLKLAWVENSQLIPNPNAEEWCALSPEKRALNTYQLTIKTYPFSEFSQQICSERNIHEIEKTLSRIIDLGWVFLDEFMDGIIAPISPKSKMFLKRTGKHWRYVPPDYSEEERTLISKIIQEWLFEGGRVAIGTSEGKMCIQTTPLGASLFK